MKGVISHVVYMTSSTIIRVFIAHFISEGIITPLLVFSTTAINN